jgi:hypothetical protein
MSSVKDWHSIRCRNDGIIPVSAKDFTLSIREVGSCHDLVSVLFNSINLSATCTVISSVTLSVSDSGFKIQSTSIVFTLKAIKTFTH